jgi:RNA polymerase sigma-70 factor (sigma-E family)
MDAAALIAPPFSLAGVVPIGAAAVADTTAVDITDDQFIVEMFQQHGSGLVRMVRMFVDDRNAAEDLVQEAFIRLARSRHRIDDGSKAAAYLRSIVLNLARDHNRRGLVSLRHHLPSDPLRASIEDTIELHEDQRMVIDALRDLPHRQRDCLILRYYDELPVPEIGEVLGISANSVKTHLKRGLRSLEANLGALEQDGDAIVSEAGAS